MKLLKELNNIDINIDDLYTEVPLNSIKPVFAYIDYCYDYTTHLVTDVNNIESLKHKKVEHTVYSNAKFLKKQIKEYKDDVKNLKVIRIDEDLEDKVINLNLKNLDKELNRNKFSINKITAIVYHNDYNIEKLIQWLNENIDEEKGHRMHLNPLLIALYNDDVEKSFSRFESGKIVYYTKENYEIHDNKWALVNEEQYIKLVDADNNKILSIFKIIELDNENLIAEVEHIK